MFTSIGRPADEATAVGAEAVLLEWLAAVCGRALAGPAGLRDWARSDPAAFRAAFAIFAGVDTGLAEIAAGWLLGAGVRPDDRVLWRADAADPCLAGLAAIGGTLTDDPAEATLVLAQPPVWPPSVKPRAANPDGD
jgi:diadenosine tetraphosphatase ApaH/serine/threonine PP2A family protein phosphatase